MIARRMQQGGRVVACVVGAIGLVVLVLGWWLDVARVREIRPGFASMKANTAACLVMAATALWLRAHTPARSPRVTSTLAIAVAAIGFVTLLQDLTGASFGIDAVLILPGMNVADAPGRMAPATAVCFIAIGGALHAANLPTPTGRRATDALGLFALCVGAVALIGYLYDVRELYTVRGYTSMAPHSALCLTCLGAAVVLTRSDGAFARLATSRTAAGHVLRRMFPVIVVLPPAIGWALHRGAEAGYFGIGFGLILFALCNSLAIGAVAWTTLSRLDQTEQVNAASIEAALDAIITIDARGRVVEWNPAAEAMFGRRRADTLGRSLAELVIPTRLREAHTAGMARFLAQGDARLLGRRHELPALHADGHEFPAEIALMVSDRGGAKLFTGYVRDLSERQRREALELENRRVEQASQLKSEFVASMSHELRTPLNAILGFSELLYDGRCGELTPKQHEFIGHVLTSGRHLLQVVNDVLDLAKIEAGKLRFEPEPVALSALIEELVASMQLEADRKAISLTVDVAPGADEVVADRGRIRQILFNFVSNALKFTGERGHVAIRARTRDLDTVRIEVEDDGIGIEPDAMPRLFTRFEQAGSSRGQGGTGLGLALTRKLAEEMGGAAGATSTLGQGSTFHVDLPRQMRRRASTAMPMR